METLNVALIGAGSRDFGRGMVRDLLLSQPIAERGLELRLMDLDLDRARQAAEYAQAVQTKLGREGRVIWTDDLGKALEGAHAVLTMIEVRRATYWAMDYHVPRRFGFRQIYGENGGPGGLFHALRNMGPLLEVARAMERLCPSAPLLNFSNPLHKVCEAISRLTRVKVVGLCHGVWMGMSQISDMLGIPVEQIDAEACGINHFTWFETIRDKATGEDLYPALRKADAEGDWLSDWHEKGLSRVLFRRFGLYPSPGANHIGEYLGWAEEFFANQLHWAYDPAQGHPWEGGPTPEFVYTIDHARTDRPWRPSAEAPSETEPKLEPTGELAAPILEGLFCGAPCSLDAIDVRNEGAIPNLPSEAVVEVPGRADGRLTTKQMAPLPEGIAAMLRLQLSIHRLLVEAHAEGDREKLLQCLLLEPTCPSYRAAVELRDEMLRLQADVLPAFA